jgi:glycine cleavage system regulatory protein
VPPFPFAEHVRVRASLVLTVIGADKPGLVELLSRTIADHDANWEESRMARLAGKFAGILRITVPTDRAAALTEALAALGGHGLRVVAEETEAEEAAERPQPVRIELVGTDRPGIIRDISRAFAGLGANVEELSSQVVSAPMAGGLLFEMTAAVLVPAAVSTDELRRVLEGLADELMVDIQLGDDAG